MMDIKSLNLLGLGLINLVNVSEFLMMQQKDIKNLKLS